MSNIDDLIRDALTHYQAGQLPKAESICRQVLREDPNHPDALHLLGGLALKAGKHDTALELINKAIASNTANPFFYSSLGVVFQALGRKEDAAQAYQRALQIRPDYAEAWNNLGTAMKSLGNLKAAIENYQKALQCKPDYAEAHINLGNALIDIGQFDTAIENYQKALQIKPDYAEAWNNMGNALKSIGRLESAIDSYRQAIRCKPDYAEARFMLACAKQHTGHDVDIQEMEKLLEDPDINEKQKVQLSFGLGKAFEDLKQFDKAFGYLSTGNSTKRKTIKYSISEDKAFFEKLVEVFDKKFFEQRANYGSSESTPIFILGMPRSGTTLVEQILSSHHQVFGAGELSDLKHVILTSNPKLTSQTFPGNAVELNNDDINRLGDEYLKRISQHNIKNKDYVTDKMPSNFLYIGMIKLLFPDAKIIHCKRGPIDTCLSCFKTDFEGTQRFAYDLTELGQYYRLYQKLMSHWHEVLPGYVYDIQYESLIADQESQTRQLLDFCGLTWDKACLSFHKSLRVIKTASFNQARHPIYKSSVQLWKQYEKHLGPLLEALENV